MRISKYLNTTAIVQRKLKDAKGEDLVDDYGKNTYNAPRTVDAAIHKQTKLVQKSHGEYVQVTTSVFLDTEIEEGDMVENRVVEAVLTIVEPWGEIAGYEAMLK